MRGRQEEQRRPEQRGPVVSLLERRRGDAFAATGRALYLLCPPGVDWTLCKFNAYDS